MYLNYKEFGIKKNRITPYWMDIELRNGAIIINGIPNVFDEGDLLI
jgi:hypothetical protein